MERPVRKEESQSTASKSKRNLGTPLVTPPTSAEKKRSSTAREEEELNRLCYKRPYQPSSSTCVRRDIFTEKKQRKNSRLETLTETSSTDSHSPGSSSVGSFSNKDTENDNSLTPISQQMTQPVDYTQDSKAGLDSCSTEAAQRAILMDTEDRADVKLITKPVYSIGRTSDSDILIKTSHVGRKHAVLNFDADSAFLTLEANNPCWTEEGDHWRKVQSSKRVLIGHNQRFRLLPPGTDQVARTKGIDYQYILLDAVETSRPGSNSADTEYLRLLRFLKLFGKEQTGNRKGTNITLHEHFKLDINLRDEKDRNLLPFTTLRYIGKKNALVESLWYLRGEDEARYLQENKCRFWDKQAIEKGKTKSWIGYNYGLLTHFPQGDGEPAVNQLEENVLKPLADKNKCSRNMICTLIKPGEETVQGSCTASIQFTVSSSSSSSVHDKRELELNLTVNQRSSDVVVGLPHDLVVWSTILHLVRREVTKRYGYKLLAGKLAFCIASGGAHYYKCNQSEFLELLRREPKKDCQPYLEIHCSADMFSLANQRFFDSNVFVIKNYTSGQVHPALKPTQAV